MKQRTTLSSAITAVLLCGAFATPLAFAQTHHKHHKSDTTATQSTTATDANATTSTDANASTNTAGSTSDTSAAMGTDQSATGQSGTYSQTTPATPATPYPGTGTPATPATPANPADAGAASMTSNSASTKQMTWADLDTDKNGTLSKTEAGAMSSLSQVFDTADGNKDGNLTADEYRAYLKSQGK